MLKVEPTREAVKNLDCWISGLRNTEGRTRKDYREIERKGDLIKINPILTWTEADVWRYMAFRKLDIHPWYKQGYRSLGCAPCSNPGGILERDGRWKGTSKCGGECGIHTNQLK
jgi:phosphoadenosine phosphosulfate reductase